MLNLLSKTVIQFAAVVCILFVFVACNNRPKGVLNQEDMTNILTDMHKLDGAMVESGIMFSNDSTKIKYYNFVFSKYNITKADFDSSLVWYTKKPQEFSKIYNKVLLNISLLEKEVKSGKYHFIDSIELAKVKNEIWRKRTKYALTKDSARTRLDFEVMDSTMLYGDVYILRFLLRIAPEDSCTKQHITLRLKYQNGKVDSAFALAHHDSLLRRYTIKLLATRKIKIKSISGELLGSKTYKGKLHATLDSISLIRKFNPVHQDSLQKLVQKLETKRKTLPKHVRADSIRLAPKINTRVTPIRK